MGREAGAIAVRLAAYLGALAAIAIVIVRLLPVTRSSALPAPARPEWTAMERPRAAFAAVFPDIPDARPDYAVLRSPGGGRKDVAIFEGQDPQGRSARIEIYRPGSEFAGFETPEREIVARAAETGTVEAAVPAPAIETRFGPMALVDFTLTRDGVPHGCLGFVGRPAEPRLQISGWFCNAAAGMVARPAVTCGLDRLTLLSSGNDASLAQFFARAELRQPVCNAKYVTAGTPFRQPDWLSGRQQTRLRGATRN